MSKRLDDGTFGRENTMALVGTQIHKGSGALMTLKIVEDAT